MKQLTKIILVLALTGVTPTAFASSVFKCIGADGEMTFSFQPCAKPEPVLEVAEAPQASQKDQLTSLDADIADLQHRLNTAKKTYEADLAASDGVRTDILTAEFDRTSAMLLQDLNDLRSQRMRIARN